LDWASEKEIEWAKVEVKENGLEWQLLEAMAGSLELL
jgi:hypothetical protein